MQPQKSVSLKFSGQLVIGIITGNIYEHPWIALVVAPYTIVELRGINLKSSVSASIYALQQP